MQTLLYPTIYITAYKFFAIAIFFLSLLVVVNALLSAKEMGGTLGSGLKKIAGGTIIHTILIITYILMEGGSRGILTSEQIQFAYLLFGTIGSAFLVFGYYHVYRVTKKLKLFTV